MKTNSASSACWFGLPGARRFDDVMQGTEPDPERAITVEGRFDLGRVLANE